jgi:hypothetical protein
MVFITLNKILSLSPPSATWEGLLRSLKKTHPDDDPISLVQIVQISGLQFALECCQLVPEFDKNWRLYAVWCARQVVWSQSYTEGLAAIAMAEQFAKGQASQAEFESTQTSMAQYLTLADGAPGKTAAATTHKIAGLAMLITAASAASAVSHYAGLKARLAVPQTRDEIADYCNLNEAYDSARFEAYATAKKVQTNEFIRLVNTLK